MYSTYNRCVMSWNAVVNSSVVVLECVLQTLKRTIKCELRNIVGRQKYGKINMPNLRVIIEDYEVYISLHENCCFLESILPAAVKNAAIFTELFSADFSALVQKGELDLGSLEQTQVLSAKQSKCQHFVIIKA